MLCMPREAAPLAPWLRVQLDVAASGQWHAGPRRPGRDHA